MQNVPRCPAKYTRLVSLVSSRTWQKQRVAAQSMRLSAVLWQRVVCVSLYGEVHVDHTQHFALMKVIEVKCTVV